MTRLWDKGAPLDEQVLQYTAGEDHVLDDRLVAYDVRASIAHARMLGAQGLLPAADVSLICETLDSLGRAHAQGQWRIELTDEDGQTALERRLIERIGVAGERIHLGRSRNDQVLAALRLYLTDAITQLQEEAQQVASALDRLAGRQGTLALPGYTHMQRAMPSTVALWAQGFAAELRDDAEGLAAARRRAGKNPLGSAAGYGTPGLQLDRMATSRELGFAGPHEPVTAVQLSRGKAEAEVLFGATLVSQDLSRLAADLLLYYTQEFAFIELPDALTTGSSIMPQKRNPDVLELVRGRSASALSCLNEALAICAKLPSGYHRDLQLLKAPLFRGIDQCRQSLKIMVAIIDGLRFVPERIRLDPALHAAEEAYALVREQGLTFREAYRRVGAKYRR